MAMPMPIVGGMYDQGMSCFCGAIVMLALLQIHYLHHMMRASPLAVTCQIVMLTVIIMYHLKGAVLTAMSINT